MASKVGVGNALLYIGLPWDKRKSFARDSAGFEPIEAYFKAKNKEESSTDTDSDSSETDTEELIRQIKQDRIKRIESNARKRAVSAAKQKATSGQQQQQQQQQNTAQTQKLPKKHSTSSKDKDKSSTKHHALSLQSSDSGTAEDMDADDDNGEEVVSPPSSKHIKTSSKKSTAVVVVENGVSSSSEGAMSGFEDNVLNESGESGNDGTHTSEQLYSPSSNATHVLTPPVSEGPTHKSTRLLPSRLTFSSDDEDSTNASGGNSASSDTLKSTRPRRKTRQSISHSSKKQSTTSKTTTSSTATSKTKSHQATTTDPTSGSESEPVPDIAVETEIAGSGVEADVISLGNDMTVFDPPKNSTEVSEQTQSSGRPRQGRKPKAAMRKVSSITGSSRMRRRLIESDTSDIETDETMNVFLRDNVSPFHGLIQLAKERAEDLQQADNKKSTAKKTASKRKSASVRKVTSDTPAVTKSSATAKKTTTAAKSKKQRETEKKGEEKRALKERAAKRKSVTFRTDTTSSDNEGSSVKPIGRPRRKKARSSSAAASSNTPTDNTSVDTQETPEATPTPVDTPSTSSKRKSILKNVSVVLTRAVSSPSASPGGGSSWFVPPDPSRSRISRKGSGENLTTMEKWDIDNDRDFPIDTLSTPYRGPSHAIRDIESDEDSPIQPGSSAGGANVGGDGASTMADVSSIDVSVLPKLNKRKRKAPRVVIPADKNRKRRKKNSETETNGDKSEDQQQQQFSAKEDDIHVYSFSSEDEDGLDEIFKSPGGREYRRFKVRRGLQKTPGVRRSERARIVPVKHWMNERLEYNTKRRSGISLEGVLVPVAPPDQNPPLPKRKKASQINEDEIHPTLKYTDEMGNQNEMTIIHTLLSTEKLDCGGDVASDKSEVVVSRLGSCGEDVASGHLMFNAYGEKSKCVSSEHSLLFYVIKGWVHFKVNGQDFKLREGASIHVPAESVYGIHNLRRSKAELLYITVFNHSK